MLKLGEYFEFKPMIEGDHVKKFKSIFDAGKLFASIVEDNAMPGNKKVGDIIRDILDNVHQAITVTMSCAFCKKEFQVDYEGQLKKYLEFYDTEENFDESLVCCEECREERAKMPGITIDFEDAKRLVNGFPGEGL